MAIDPNKVGLDMIAAATGVFSGKWPAIQMYAEDELKDFAVVLGRIATRYAAGTLSKENAQAMVRAQVESMKIVFMAVEGMGILMVEAAINAAIDVVRTAINNAIGFALL
ncbi:MAG: hypothetical protein HQK59_05995 [Deltaproteobacteria bacterium]|nr:hypothetical protein [Deltaproteobacteria bacterium]